MKLRTDRVTTLDDETKRLITQRCEHGCFYLTCVLCERIDQCVSEGTEPDWFFVPNSRPRHALS